MMTREIRLQILAAKKEAGSVAEAVASVHDRMHDLEAIGRDLGAEALLVCPAPKGYASEGIDVAVFARFDNELDEDAIFWRQRDLAEKIRERMKLAALVMDFDGQVGGPAREFVKTIAPLLAFPYQDEIGNRGL